MYVLHYVLVDLHFLLILIYFFTIYCGNYLFFFPSTYDPKDSLE